MIVSRRAGRASARDARFRSVCSRASAAGDRDRRELGFGSARGPWDLYAGAHRRIARREKPADPARIDAIADRLEAMLGPSPDIHALRLRAALLRGRDIPPVPCTDPPMLREGLSAFVEASHFVPEIIPPGSALEYACVERLMDSPLSSWPSGPKQPAEDDWLTVALREIVRERGEESLTAVALARELGVPTLAVARRLEEAHLLGATSLV